MVLTVSTTQRRGRRRLHLVRGAAGSVVLTVALFGALVTGTVAAAPPPGADAAVAGPQRSQPSQAPVAGSAPAALRADLGGPPATIENFGLGLQHPSGITAGPDGNLWFVNSGNNSIGRSTPDGVITNTPLTGVTAPKRITMGADGNLWITAAGAIVRMHTGGTTTVFTDPKIVSPSEITPGPDGALWFVDTASKLIGSISVAGAVTTHTGPAITSPTAIVAGDDGNLWFANAFPATPALARITTTGAVTAVPLPDNRDVSRLARGPDGNVWFTGGTTDVVGRVTPAGGVTVFASPDLALLGPIVAGADGNLWLASRFAAGRLGRITPDGVMTTFGGAAFEATTDMVVGPDGNVWYAKDNSVGSVTPAGASSVFRGSWVDVPNSITSGPDGALWYGNASNDSIGRITLDGSISHIDAGILTGAVESLTVGADGTLWYESGGSLRRMTPDGTVTTFPGYQVHYVTAGPDGNVWFTVHDWLGGNSAIGRVTPDGTVTLFKGSSILSPQQIAAGPDGNLWFLQDKTLGRVTPTGDVMTFTDPTWRRMSGLAAGPDGNVWVTNVADLSVGRVTPQGQITYLSTGALAPVDITAGPDGALWFTTAGSAAIGRITVDGTVTSVSDASVAVPNSITTGRDGAVWFTDRGSNAIGRVTLAPEPPSNIVAEPRTDAARVTWVAPATAGGKAITGYTVTAAPGGATCTWTAGPLTCEIEGLTPGMPYTFTVTASNGVGTGRASAPSDPVTPRSGAAYHPVPPTRILDSRTTTGSWTGPLGAGSPQVLQVTGAAGGVVIPVAASAVVMNVTVTEGSANSFVTAWPTGGPQPTSSNLNFGAGETIANLATAKVGVGGTVSFANASGHVHVIADVLGYYDDGSGSGDLFTATSPTRVLDSRVGGGWGAPLVAGTPRDLLVRQPLNVLGAPTSATAVVVNVTVTGGTAASYVSVWPSDGEPPTVSNLNFGPGQTIPNLAIIKIGTNGAIRFANASGAVDVVVDMVGYFDPTGGSRFRPIDPVRVLDDRIGLGSNGPWGPGESRVLPVAGAVGTTVPTGATALVANVTATGSTAASFVTVYPGGVPKPDSSSLNFGAGQTIPNLVVVGLGAGGVAFANQRGTVDLVADAVGYFVPS